MAERVLGSTGTRTTCSTSATGSAVRGADGPRDRGRIAPGGDGGRLPRARGLRRWWDDVFQILPDYRVEVLQACRLGEGALAHIRDPGSGGAGGAPVIDPFWQVAVGADGKCVWWRNCSTKAEALEALGLASELGHGQQPARLHAYSTSSNSPMKSPSTCSGKLFSPTDSTRALQLGRGPPTCRCRWTIRALPGEDARYQRRELEQRRALERRHRQRSARRAPLPRTPGSGGG